MAPAFDREGAGSRKRDADGERRQEKSPGAEGAVDRGLLEKVVEQTLLSLGGSEPPAPEDVAALREVVSRHSGRRFGLDPVAVEMVEAVLRDQLEQLRTHQSRRAMVVEIATTLYEDQDSHDRLLALWNKLSEAQP
ncbi:MAG: hypothetical protein WD847_11145 [Pirellulales bacterium]